MTEILFIRHGETDCNKKHLYYGHLNPSLNKTGINQLKNTKKKLEKMNEKIDIIFSSDLKRCRESLEILGIDKNIKQHFSENLRELNFGILEGKTYKEIENQFLHYVNEMENNWRNFKAEGGESLSDLQKRSVEKINILFINIIKINKSVIHNSHLCNASIIQLELPIAIKIIE